MMIPQAVMMIIIKNHNNNNIIQKIITITEEMFFKLKKNLIKKSFQDKLILQYYFSYNLKYLV